MPRLALLAVPLLALIACYEDNPESCELPANMLECGGMPGELPCTNNGGCVGKPGGPVCDMSTGTGTCVPCTASDPGMCGGTAPLCRSNTCVACANNSECGANGLCLPRGDCALSAQIIRARPNGSTTAGCGSMGNECDLTRALTEVTADRNVILLAGGAYSSNTAFDVKADVTIDARANPTVTRSGDGPIFTVTGGKTATIFGGIIENARGDGTDQIDPGDALQCTNATLTIDSTVIRNNHESGIKASQCMLTVTNAQLNNNSNRGGARLPAITITGGKITLARSSIIDTRGNGLTVGDPTIFVVVGNAFLNNGDTSGPTAGISIVTGANEDNRLDFNTVVANKTQGTNVAGVRCSVSDFTAKNNIIYGNVGKTVETGCKYAWSDIGPTNDFTDNNAGNNINAPPLLMSDTSNPHLQSLSPARGAADPTADLKGIAAKDIDGDTRVSPADMGADEAP